MGTVIIGAGIIGLSTAFYLTETSAIAPSDVHIVEFSTELYASASGYAGGYLERGQFPRNSAPLGNLSFDLHAQLAHDHDGSKNWGYSKTIRMALDQTPDGLEDDALQSSASGLELSTIPGGPQWLKESLHQGLIRLGEGNSAIV
jgi:glycine/D-amino acid oxidase-like deaminating enzyme